MEFSIRITGTKTLIMHNGRLANPLDPYTRKLKELTSKRQKTDEDLIAIMEVEARAGAYETADDLLGIPVENMWRCIYDAAKAFKRGEDIKRAFFPMDADVVPITVNGEFVNVDKYLIDPDHIDYRPVKVTTSKVMRARPVVAAGWTATYAFDVLDDVINARDLDPILDRAGRLVGLCEWRPLHGTFTWELV